MAPLIAARSVRAAVLDTARVGRQRTMLGVYEESLNLLSGEEVVSVICPETGYLPRGIVAGLPPGLGWKQLGLSAADRVYAGPDRLEVPGKLRIDFSNAVVWQPRRRLMSSCGQTEAVGRAVRKAASVLEGSGGLGALPPTSMHWRKGDLSRTSKVASCWLRRHHLCRSSCVECWPPRSGTSWRERAD